MINFRELFTFHSEQENTEARLFSIGLLLAAICVQYLQGFI